MVQIKALSTPVCLSGQLEEEEEHRVVLHVKAEHYQKKSQGHKPKSKIPGLVPVDCKSGFHINHCTVPFN